MVRAKSKSSLSDCDRLQQVFDTGRLKRADYVIFTNLLLSGNRLSESEREKVNQLFDLLRAGRVQLID
jgi:hypothetical protein